MSLPKTFIVLTLALGFAPLAHAAKVGMRTRTAEESAERALAKKPATAPASAPVAAAPAAPVTPPPPTTQSLLNPTYAPAFDAAVKAAEQYKVPEGLKISVF